MSIDDLYSDFKIISAESGRDRELGYNEYEEFMDYIQKNGVNPRDISDILDGKICL